MNALDIIRHAYETIANANPGKDVQAIVSEVEDVVKRLVSAAVTLETALGVKAVAPVADLGAQTQG